MELDTIVCGDCLDVIADMPNGCVDLVVTSPPYNNWENKRSSGGSRPAWRPKHRNIEYGKFIDKMPEKDYQGWQQRVILEMLRITKREGTVVYNHKNRIRNWGIISPLIWILPVVNIRQEIIWDRTSSPQVSPVRFLPSTERLYLLGDGRPFFNPKHLRDGEVWNIRPTRFEGIPAFPLELVSRCIRALCPQEGVIFDPFMGSGTTAVAALKLGRHFYGCDINEDYVRLANERIEKAQLEMAQLRMAM